MKLAPKLIRIVMFLLLFVAGVFCLLEFFSYDSWKALASYLSGVRDHQTARIILGLTGILLLSLPLAMIFFWNRRRLRTSSFRIPLTPEPVALRLSAIEEFAVREAEEHPLIDSARVFVRKWGKVIYVQLKVNLHPDEKVLIICEEVRKKVRDSLETVLGIPEVRVVSIQVDKTCGNEWI